MREQGMNIAAFFPVRGTRGVPPSLSPLGVLLVLVAGAAGRGEEGPPVKPPVVTPADPALAARPGAPGGIVAIVNDDVITQAELDLAVRRERAGLERLYSPAVVERELPRIQRVTLDRMIEQRLVLQLVRREEEKEGKPYVTEADIEREIKEEWKKLQDAGLKVSTQEDLFRFWREMYGAEREELRKYIKDLLAVQFHLQRHVFTPHAFVSPQELRAHYLKHVRDFTTPVAISFYQITVPRSHLQVELIVAEIEKGLAQGVDFCDLARKFDQEALRGDPESACRLWTKTFEELEKWHEPIREQLRKMKKGETSERVLTAVGIHYLKVEDVIEGAPRPFSEVQDEITMRIRAARNHERMANFFDRLKQRSRIQVLLPLLSSGAAQPPPPPAAGDPARGAAPGGEQAPPPAGGGGDG